MWYNCLMKSKVYLIIFVVLLAAISTYFYWRPKPEQKPAEISSFEECAAAGYPIMESYPERCRTPDGKTFARDIGNELEKSDLIRVSSPRSGQTIVSPLEISGEARGFWFFEASFPVKIFDDNGFLLGILPAQAEGEWMTENFVLFKAKIHFAAPSTQNGVLILEKDNPSGLPEYADELKFPIVFEEVGELTKGDMMTVKIFLNDSKYVNEPYFDCSKTVAVNRSVPKTQAVAKSATEALLRGATEEEANKGFINTIPIGVRLSKITIENGIAKVDFDDRLEYQVGGSCRVAAIRAQIVDTLKQFPTVKEVVVSVNGRTEDILQP